VAFRSIATAVGATNFVVFHKFLRMDRWTAFAEMKNSLGIDEIKPGIEAKPLISEELPSTY
jgi:hypothetical protein